MEKPQYKWNDNAGDTNHVVVGIYTLLWSLLQINVCNYLQTENAMIQQ